MYVILHFLLAKLFLSSASGLLNFFMNWASGVAYYIVILRHFLYLLVCDISRFRSSYVVSMWSFFLFSPSLSWWLSYNLTNIGTLVLLFIFQNVLLFLDDNLGEECEYFSNSKSSASECCSQKVQLQSATF